MRLCLDCFSISISFVFWTRVIIAGTGFIFVAVGACDGLPTSSEQVDAGTHRL
jgi:hypothetical protein